MLSFQLFHFCSQLTPSDHITFGANVNITAFEEAFEQTTDPGLPYAKAFVTHLGRCASSSLRNVSTCVQQSTMKIITIMVTAEFTQMKISIILHVFSRDLEKF